jgi:hypothetical protein
MAAPKKPSAIVVERDRKTTALPPMQLGSFHKLFTPDEYEGKKKFKSRFHLNPKGMTALKAALQAKCIDQHFDAMKAEVDQWTADAKAAKKTPPVAICETKDGCQSPEEWLEEKLREPHEKDKVQLPTIQLHVDAYLPLRKGQDEADRELRTIKFWDAKGVLIEDPEKRLAKMTSGTWVQPIVHANLFLSKQLGKNPRPMLQLVGLQVIKLVEYGSSEAPPSAADEDEMRRIMGDDYSVDDDLANITGGIAPADESGVDEDPF